MAVSFVWPLSLPQQPLLSGYGESRGLQIQSTPMERGPAKRRVRGLRPDVLALSYVLSEADLATFETFVMTTLRGVYRFGFPHPRTGEQVEVRVVPGEGGDLYSLQPAGKNWRVSLQVEVLP